MTSPAALTAATPSRPSAAASVSMPLTERVLDRLPGPRIAWLLAWGLSPFAAYEIAYRLWQLPTYAGLESNLTIGIVNLVGLWGAGRLAARIDSLEPYLERLLRPEDLTLRTHPFRLLGSAKGPLAIAALFVLSWDFLDYLAHPGPATAFAVVAIFFAMVAVATFVWVYGVALLGLDRIGRRQLRLDPFTTDPHLGLKPLGTLAFEAFLLAGLSLAPVLLGLLSDVRSVVETLAFVAVVSALFVLSAYTLHRTLARAKSAHVRWARQLVAVALGPVDLIGDPAGSSDRETVGKGVVGSLGSAAPSLAVAVEIERRALAIQEWPFDTAIIRTVAAILTSVTAVIIARLLLSQFGM